MVASIHFDYEFAIGTKEINNELSYDILKQKLMSQLIRSYITSQHRFSFSWIRPHPFCPLF